MIPVSNEVLNYLAESFAFEPSTLEKIGGGREDSDGVVYASGYGLTRRTLKIIAKNINDASAYFKTFERAHFFAYLGEHEVPVVTPMPNANGRLIESCPIGEHIFLAYSYPFLHGETLRPEKWSDEVLESWGALIGQTHRLTQNYPVFDGIINPTTGEKTLNWHDEIKGFLNWCADEEVKDVWRSFQDRVSALPATRKICGMVQNDPHMENLLIHENNLCLIDFDVSNCHFFASDIAIAIQSVLFTLSGGMERPLSDKDALLHFVCRLLKGYRQECDLPIEVLDAIELFIAYRRALLFTVMQDWLKTRPEQFETWKRLTIEQPPIMELIKGGL